MSRAPLSFKQEPVTFQVPTTLPPQAVTLTHGSLGAEGAPPAPAMEPEPEPAPEPEPPPPLGEGSGASLTLQATMTRPQLVSLANPVLKSFMRTLYCCGSRIL